MGLSSSRKVAAIFSSVKKKIRIFDMEVEEEEEEEEEEVEDDDDDDIDEQPSNLSYSNPFFFFNSNLPIVLVWGYCGLK